LYYLNVSLENITVLIVMNTLKVTFGLATVSLLMLSACGGVEQATQTIEKNKDSITALAGSQAGLLSMKDGVTETLTAVKAGDFTKAQAEFGKIQETWQGLEAGLKGISAEKTAAVKGQLDTVATELKAPTPDKAKLTTSLAGMTKSLGGFAVGAGESMTEPMAAGADFQSNLTAMKDALGKATTATEASDFAAARDAFGSAKQSWYSFGGGVKQQSADAYQKLDNGVKTVNTALAAASPVKTAVLGDIKALSDELNALPTK
jgi:hypothetical protein